MGIKVTCPHCNKPATAPDDAAGKKARCKGCENVFVIQPAGGRPARALFVEGMEVRTAPDAVSALFDDGAVDRIRPAADEHIRAGYADLSTKWGDNGLFCGTAWEIRAVVQANLAALVADPGFVTVKVETFERGKTNVAQASAIVGGLGMVGIRVWKALDGRLYVCGTQSFRGEPRLLAPG